MNEGSIYRVETIDNTPVAVPYANLSLGDGAELKSYTYSTEQEEPFRPNRSGDICGTSLLTYGNISFLKIRYIFKSALTLSKLNWFVLCTADIYDNLLDVEGFERYLIAPHTKPSYVGSGGFLPMEIIGVPKGQGNNLCDKIIIHDHDTVYVTSSSVESMIKYYEFQALEDLTISQNDYLEIDHIFLNSIGKYKNLYS